MRFKKGRKGFTLIELIVVLVILAVLAALLVPALTGYIDKAKEKSVVAEARMILQAVQTEVSEIYGTSDWKQIGKPERLPVRTECRLQGIRRAMNGKKSVKADIRIL